MKSFISVLLLANLFMFFTFEAGITFSKFNKLISMLQLQVSTIYTQIFHMNKKKLCLQNYFLFHACVSYNRKRKVCCLSKQIINISFFLWHPNIFVTFSSVEVLVHKFLQNVFVLYYC